MIGRYDVRVRSQGAVGKGEPGWGGRACCKSLPCTEEGTAHQQFGGTWYMLPTACPTIAGEVQTAPSAQEHSNTAAPLDRRCST